MRRRVPEVLAQSLCFSSLWGLSLCLCTIRQHLRCPHPSQGWSPCALVLRQVGSNPNIVNVSTSVSSSIKWFINAPLVWLALPEKDLWVSRRESMKVDQLVDSWTGTLNPSDTKSGCNFLMEILAHGVCVLWQQWTNSHGLQKSCGEKGVAWPLSEWDSALTLA